MYLINLKIFLNIVMFSFVRIIWEYYVFNVFCEMKLGIVFYSWLLFGLDIGKLV